MTSDDLREHPIQRFLVRKRTTFTWLVPLCLFVASYVWGVRSIAEYAAGTAFAALGELMRVWAAGTIHKDDTVATTGPYALVRNPLYFGSFLIAIGYALMSGLGPVAWVTIIVLFLLFHLAAIFSEEAFLRRKFGPPYEDYLKSVPRLFPRLLPRRSPRDAPAQSARFTWGQAVNNREQITALITACVAIAFALRFVVPGVHVPSPFPN